MNRRITPAKSTGDLRDSAGCVLLAPKTSSFEIIILHFSLDVWADDPPSSGTSGVGSKHPRGEKCRGCSTLNRLFYLMFI
jgi:hypothetical protein